MYKYEFIDLTSDEYFDIFIEVDFAQSLDTAQVVQVLKLLTDILTSDMANQLCEGISLLQLNEMNFAIQLRFTAEGSPRFKANISSRAKAQFTFYLLAKIDSLFPLGDVHLPDGWRGWLNFPEHIAEYGYEHS